MTEVVEQDTDEIEEIQDMGTFLRIGAVPEFSCSQVGYYYNRKVFDGWVKQPSACCGASSVAGAWNALGAIKRRDFGALSHLHILTVYHSMFIDLIDKGRSSFERRLGTSIKGLLSDLEHELSAVGRSIGGKKGSNATKLVVMSALKKMARTRLASLGDQGKQPADHESSKSEALILPASGLSDDVKEGGERYAIDCIIELFRLDGTTILPSVSGKDCSASEDAIITPVSDGFIDSEKKAAGVVDDEDEEVRWIFK
jgi:hypothetical protein